MKRFVIIVLMMGLQSCSTTYDNKNPVGKNFVAIVGNSLDGKTWQIPEDLKGGTNLLLLGYKQRSQFDIDRWLIGLDMSKTAVNVFEIPAIQSWFAGLFRASIDEGMRKGIPGELWKVVITVYDDGDKIQEFTGNENPNNARVVLLNKAGVVQFFYDRGFSVAALNQLRAAIAGLPQK